MCYHACRCSHDHASNRPGTPCWSHLPTSALQVHHPHPWLRQTPSRTSDLIAGQGFCRGSSHPDQRCKRPGYRTHSCRRDGSWNLNEPHRHVLSALYTPHRAHQTVLAGAQADCQSVLHLMPCSRFGRAQRVSSWHPAHLPLTYTNLPASDQMQVDCIFYNEQEPQQIEL